MQSLAFNPGKEGKGETLTYNDLGSFGELLRTFRTRTRLTQQQLARDIGLHRNAISRWERGDFLPKGRSQVLELARHLKLDDQEKRQLLEASLTASSPYWSVPLPRNLYFTGREKILEVLYTHLGVDQTAALTQPSALHGLGGIGKTQIALEYAYRYALDYGAVFWIRAETPEQILSSFWQIAETLHLPEGRDKDQERLMAAVKRWLSTHSQWLLIWDNLEDLTLLDQFLPPTRSGALLLTTRLQALGTFAQSLDLEPMEQEEALLFLLRRAKALSPGATREHIQELAAHRPEDYCSALEIVTLLGGLPLALDQAGAYLEETRCGLSMYLALLRSQSEILLHRRGNQIRDHPESVTSTFHLSLAATIERNPAACALLEVCALLQADAIPEELFLQGASYLGRTVEAACRDAFEWNQVVAAACAYSLLHRQSEKQTFSMHRLVQAVLKDLLPQTIQRSWRKRVLCAISHLFPSDEREQADYWRQGERLLPHAVLCLMWSEGDKAIRVTLMSRVATYFSECTRYPEAESLFLQALRLGEQSLGADHPQIGEVLARHGKLYWNQEKYAEAEALYQRALRLGEHSLGSEHPQVATALRELAGVYGELGRYAEAETLYERALRICESTLGAEHPRVATVLQGLAQLFNELGRYAEAETLYERALRIRERLLGMDHPQVATVLNNLAVTYCTQGKIAEGEPLLQRALHIWEQTLGPEHPRVGYPLLALAEVRQEQGRYVEAEPLLRRALHIWELVQGVQHRHIACALYQLAQLSQVQSRDEEAEELFHRALSLQEQHLDPQHPDIADTLHDLAMFRQRQGRLGEALSLAERALAIRSRSLGDTHPQTIATYMLYAQLGEAQMGATEDQCVQEQGAPYGSQFRKAALTAQTPPTFPVKEEASFETFLTACCEQHPRAWCSSRDLWRAYTRWAERQQERYPLSRSVFIAQLKAHGCHADRTKSTRIWRGIAFVKNNDDGG